MTVIEDPENIKVLCARILKRGLCTPWTLASLNSSTKSRVDYKLSDQIPALLSVNILNQTVSIRNSRISTKVTVGGKTCLVIFAIFVILLTN